MVAALLLGWLLSRCRPFRVTLSSGAERFETLDGLRGFLATGVMFHHMAVMRHYQLTDSWSGPDTNFYRLLGPIPVVFFFMLTGFLFWDKAIASGGNIEAWKLYRGRVYRIVPLYAVLLAGVIIVTSWESDAKLRVPPALLAEQLGNAFTMGIRQLLSINKSDVGNIAGTVTWTLRYEWRFYAMLPVIAGLAALRRNSIWLLLGPLIFLGFLGADNHYAIFLFGMAAAHLARIASFKKLMCSRVVSVAILAGVVAIWQWAQDAYTFPSYFLCFAVFLPIVCGNDLWGFLRHPSARHLGAISYSTYLLHTFVLYVIYFPLGFGSSIAALSPAAFWAVMTGIVALIVLICTVTYTYVEYPFMHTKPFPADHEA